MFGTGEVKYENRFNQPLLFQGMVFDDKICLTDVDAITEYHNRLFIIMEVKGLGVPLNIGQTKALQRLVDALQEAKKTSILFICRHNISDISSPVLLKDTIVSEVYYNKQWFTIKPKNAYDVWSYALQWQKNKEQDKWYE